ncbi:hypothetical protein F4861DRAFT_546600 [Xylaria intraflava]|nr:hypothetical protein F4861DRAFT_546600 [Xylaria intraflava]
MSSPATVKFSVSPRETSPSTPSNKRGITPSAEQSSSKGPRTHQGQINLEPFFAPRQLFSNNVAAIARDPTCSPFNLRDPSIDIYEGEASDLLYQIFPKTTNATEARWRSHLIFQVEELPKSPWPLTVGRVPFTIDRHGGGGRALIFPKQILCNPTNSIRQEGYDIEKFSDELLRRLAAEVHSVFEKNMPKIRIVELMFTAERTIYIVLEDHIARCTVGYLTNRELHRPLRADLPVKQRIEPQLTSSIIDNTAYDILRPGVLISSKFLKEHGHPATFPTTSGILVQNRSGDRFMTGASHGISGDGNIWQGDQPGRSIGKAVVEIPFTDIGLVKLKDDITFVNQTFENNSGESPAFSRLATSKDICSFSTCFLNSPYAGNIEASILSKFVKFEASTHPTENKLRYVVYNWSYMGQTEGNNDRICPHDGTCGSAIWDDDGIITGFYRLSVLHKY